MDYQLPWPIAKPLSHNGRTPQFLCFLHSTHLLSEDPCQDDTALPNLIEELDKDVDLEGCIACWRSSLGYHPIEGRRCDHSKPAWIWLHRLRQLSNDYFSWSHPEAWYRSVRISWLLALVMLEPFQKLGFFHLCLLLWFDCFTPTNTYMLVVQNAHLKNKMIYPLFYICQMVFDTKNYA